MQTEPQDELDESKDEAAREAKRIRLFQEETELLKAVTARLETERLVQAEVHESFVQQTTSAMECVSVIISRTKVFQNSSMILSHGTAG